jgi:hypothetical protein
MEESSMITWMSSNVNILADTATRAKYIIALKAARELGVVSSVLVLCSSIVRQYWQHSFGQETKVSLEDQFYTMTSHRRWVMCADAKDMQIQTDLKVSDP